MNKIKFGTDGIRGQINSFPFNDREAIIALGKSIGVWAKKNSSLEKNKVLIVPDLRFSSEVIFKCLATGFFFEGFEIDFANFLTTPAAFFAATDKVFDYSVVCVVTASHLPSDFNGVKIFSREGRLLKEDEAKIEEIFSKEIENQEKLKEAPKFKVNDFSGDVLKKSFKRLLSFENIEQKEIAKKNFKVVVDCANGSVFRLSKFVFEGLGCKTVLINNRPNGRNINLSCGTENILRLKKRVFQENADFGFAFDGDADRLKIVLKDGSVLSGDQVAYNIAFAEKSNLDFFVVSKMANSGLKNSLKALNVNLKEAQVGERSLVQVGGNKNFIASEPSGHIIFSKHQLSSDALFNAAKFLDSFVKNKEIKIFEKTPEKLISFNRSEKFNSSSKDLKELVKKVSETISSKEGRVFIRDSGTQNLTRIFIEDKNAEKLALELFKGLENLGVSFF